MIEVRQDLIATEAQQARWGDLLARVLREAVDVCDSNPPSVVASSVSS
jgi:predicted N-formylglutamate amidohydrolase